MYCIHTIGSSLLSSVPLQYKLIWAVFFNVYLFFSNSFVYAYIATKPTTERRWKFWTKWASTTRHWWTALTCGISASACPDGQRTWSRLVWPYFLTKWTRSPSRSASTALFTVSTLTSINSWWKRPDNWPDQTSKWVLCRIIVLYVKWRQNDVIFYHPKIVFFSQRLELRPFSILRDFSIIYTDTFAHSQAVLCITWSSFDVRIYNRVFLIFSCSPQPSSTWCCPKTEVAVEPP